MEQSADQAVNLPRRRRNTTVEGIVTTVEWVIVALVLAFVFRTFIMEQFRIPTGSMAETLRGAHHHLRCTRCGYKYDVESSYAYNMESRCPSCGYYIRPDSVAATSNGDRIFVLKSIYSFSLPKRWDVIVFKYPAEPTTNYIKRLIARPGETVEIIDGDIYIDGEIAQKPPLVQQEFWTPIFDNDYQPFGTEIQTSQRSDSFEPNNTAWKQPFSNEAGSKWDLAADGPTVFGLDSEIGEMNTIAYDVSAGNPFKATLAYNNSIGHDRKPICSDLMISFYVLSDKQTGLISASLSKYQTLYRGVVDFSGLMMIEKITDNRSEVLTRREIKAMLPGKSRKLDFANVDHQLVLKFGKDTLRHNLGLSVDAVGAIDHSNPPVAKISAAGTLKLYHIAIFRDQYYLGERILRAGPGNPFTLGEDEFFACGDNSANSLDSRLWPESGIGDNNKLYRPGIVPRDYLVGKAFLIYWGDPSKPFGDVMPLVPNLSRIHPIYGGAEVMF